MKKCVKKILVIFIIQTLLIMLIPIVSRAEVSVDKETDDDGIKLTVRSSSPVIKVRMYLKNNEDVWTKFFENSESGYTVKPFYFPYSELSTEKKDQILVRIETVDGIEDVELGGGNPNDDGNTGGNTGGGTGSGDELRDNPTSGDVEPDEEEDDKDEYEDDDDVEVPSEEQGIAVNERIVLDMPSKTTKDLTVKFPEGIEKDTLTWETSNKTVATVDTNGKVTAVGPGVCMVNVKRGEYTASCIVIVKFRGKKIENGDKAYFLDTQKGVSEGATVGSDKHNEATLLECKGKYALIDTSTEGMSDRVIKYLKDLNITELEWVLITCFDSEHCGGYDKISDTVKIKELYMKKIDKMTWHDKIKNSALDTTNKSEGKTKLKYISESENSSVNLEDIKIDFYNRNLTPLTIQGEIERLGGTIKLSNAALSLPNMYSIVAVANMNGRKVAFMGDQSSESATYTHEENVLLQKICDENAGKIADIDIYKAANHGINGNRLSELNIYKPEYVVVTHELIAKSSTAQESPSENFKKFAEYTQKADGTKVQNIYYTGKGTRVLSVNGDSDIYFKKLANDDTGNPGDNDLKFRTDKVNLYAYTGSAWHTANMANSIQKGKTENMKWSISDTSIATVDEYGLVTAIKPGTTVLTVKNNKDQTATCNINVIGLVENSTNYAYMENNTRYLQELIDTASKNAGRGSNAKQQTVSIPKGTYNFVADGTNDYIIHCMDNVLVEGAGKYETILKPYGNFSRRKNGIMMFSDWMHPGSEPKEYYDRYLYDADFKNFTIDGIDTKYIGEFGGMGRGIRLGLAKNCDIDSVIVKNTDGIGFYMVGPVGCTINDCEALYCGKAIEKNVSGSGFFIAGGYVDNESIKITNSYAGFNSAWGFGMGHQSANYSEDNQPYTSYGKRSFIVENCRACGNLYDFGGIRASDVTFKNCKSESPDSAPEIDGRSNCAFNFCNFSVRCNVIDCTVDEKFEDVKKDDTSYDYAYDAINWALSKGITNGVAKWKFAPKSDVDRGMAIEMIWRAEGRPGESVQNRTYKELKTIKNGQEVDLESGFSDSKLTKDKYYFMGVKWGKEAGIIDGIGGNKYSPQSPCTRAQFVTMLWRLKGSPKGNPNTKFTDIPEDKWYTEAVKWATANKITAGTSGTTFSPDRTITRAEAVTMLYRYYNK